MKILMLTPYLPFPLLSGGQIRTYNLLKNLAAKHEVTLFSFIRHDSEARYKNELLTYCKRVETFKRRPAWSILNILLAGLTPFPFLVSIYYSRKLQRAIARELKHNNYDLIHSETFYVMPNIPKTKVPILLVEQTIEYLVYQHFVETVALPVKILLSFDVTKIRFWEKYYWRKAQKVVAMSRSDKEVMKREVPNLDVDMVPNGVDIIEFSKIRRNKNHKPTVLFVGNFKWLQNKEAVSILVKKIWPIIKKNIPDVLLWIVGRFPTQEIKNYQNDSIRVSENIDDIKYAYANSDVLLAPIYGPGGTRYKILEAMASGIPVVTTSRGIEGLEATEKDVLIKEEADALAQVTISVLRDSTLYRSLSENGKRLVHNNYDWKKISQKLDKLYKEVARTQ